MDSTSVSLFVFQQVTFRQGTRVLYLVNKKREGRGFESPAFQGSYMNSTISFTGIRVVLNAGAAAFPTAINTIGI